MSVKNPTQAALYRDLAHCAGWGCLTWAERFGIIFSIVVVSVVLLLAYMYYLGRATVAYRERTSRRRPGERRVGREQPWSGYPALGAYQPAAFSPLRAYGPGAHPHTTDLNSALWFYPQRPPAITYAVLPMQPPLHREEFRVPEPPAPAGFNRQSRQPSPRAHSENSQQPRQPTWLQRLSRAIRLPVGTASTIASTTAPGTPRDTRLTVAEDESPVLPSDTLDREEVAPNGEEREIEGGRQPRPTSADVHGDAVGEDDAQSLQTNVATVHSDDFQIMDPPSPLVRHLGTAPAPERGTGSS
jgi:hypothetical protein